MFAAPSLGGVVLLASPVADGLPPGAARRLGSAVFRTPNGVGETAFSPDGKVIYEVAVDPHHWLVGRDAVNGRFLWRADMLRRRNLSGPVAEPGRVRLLERLDFKTVRFVWFDQSTGKEAPPGEPIDLGRFRENDQSVTADSTGRWLLVDEQRWVNTVGIEETKIYSLVLDRLGTRPPLELGLARVAFTPGGKFFIAVPPGGRGFGSSIC